VSNTAAGAPLRQSKTIKCPHCTRKFSSDNDVSNHVSMKHKAFRPEREESFADRAIQAEIDRACGIPSDDDWLLS
jgi:hypothetical protein